MDGDWEKKFRDVYDTVELVLRDRNGWAHNGTSVSSEACVACRGGARLSVMEPLSEWLVARGIDVDFLAWQINRQAPEARARVFDGTLLIEGCGISVVVLADLISTRLPCVEEAPESRILFL